MWEVDPDQRIKLLDIQKRNGNNVCVDCDAPSPQWASPKFGIFMCLSCSGVHRSLGVHISFVRSVSMDSFKPHEVARLAAGGNNAWRTFFDEHESNALTGRSFAECSIAERYDSDAGMEWKGELGEKVGEKKADASAGSRAGKKPAGGGGGAIESFTGKSTTQGLSLPSASTSSLPPSSTGSLQSTWTATRAKSSSPSPSQTSSQAAPPSRRTQNEAFFARKGAENAQRRTDVPPSQGGQYVGFGSGGADPSEDNGGSGIGKLGGFGDFQQQDPVATLTKGLSWFGSVVGQGVQKISTSNVSTQARQTAAHLSETVLQPGARTAAQQLVRFVDPDSHPGDRGAGGGGIVSGFGSGGRAGADAEQKDFWDRFGGGGNGAGAGTSADAGAMMDGLRPSEKKMDSLAGGMAGMSVGRSRPESEEVAGEDAPFEDAESRRNSISDLLRARDENVSTGTSNTKADTARSSPPFPAVSDDTNSQHATPPVSRSRKEGFRLGRSSSPSSSPSSINKGTNKTVNKNKNKPANSSCFTASGNNETSNENLSNSLPSLTAPAAATASSSVIGSSSSARSVSRSSSLGRSASTSARPAKSSIGTGVMKKGGAGGGGGVAMGGGMGGEAEGEWGDW